MTTTAHPPATTGVLKMLRAEVNIRDFQRWMGTRRLQDPDHAMHCLLTECFGDLAPRPFRLMARHGTAPPLMPDTSEIARKQMRAWGDAEGSRITIARKMYALRLGKVLPHRGIEALRGIEGARMRRTYQTVAQRYGIQWQRRRYDRNDPMWADIPNQAINHASVAVTSAAVIAVSALGAIPQLGFIHEHSGEAFALDVADLFRDTILLPAAFKSARAVMDNPTLDIERHTRRTTGELLRNERVISKMIDRIKTLFDDVIVPEEDASDGGEESPTVEWDEE